MKWSDIKNNTLKKLFLDDTDNSGMNNEYVTKFVYLANECLNMIANSVKPNVKVHTAKTDFDNEYKELPDDFISFSDRVNYLQIEDGRMLPDPDIIYFGSKDIVLPIKGEYRIFYNAEWEHIPEDVEDNYKLEIDNSVLNCLPTYIAAQCLAQDDIQRSTILKNEFELMLSRLDTNEMYQPKHFHSNGGWY